MRCEEGDQVLTLIWKAFYRGYKMGLERTLENDETKTDLLNKQKRDSEEPRR